MQCQINTQLYRIIGEIAQEDIGNTGNQLVVQAILLGKDQLDCLVYTLLKILGRLDFNRLLITEDAGAFIEIGNRKILQLI